MDIFKSIREQQLKDKMHIINAAEHKEEEITKSLDNEILVNVLNNHGVELQKEEIMKGKKAVLGEIRVYSGISYQKVSETGNPNKDWQRVKSDKATKDVKSEEKYEPTEKEKVQALQDKKLGDIYAKNPKAVVSPTDTVKADWDELKEKLDMAKVHLDKLKSLGYSLYSKENFKKKLLNDAFNDVQTAEINIGRFEYGHKELKKIFKEFDLKASKFVPTAIKGYSPPDMGYEFTVVNPETIRFNGVSINKFNEIKDKIEELGFSISSYKEPSKVFGGLSVSSISVKKFHDPDKSFLDKAADGEVSGKEFNQKVSEATGVNVNKDAEFQPKDHTTKVKVTPQMQGLLDSLVGQRNELNYYMSLQSTDGKKVGGMVSSLRAKLSKAEKYFSETYPQYNLERSGKSNYYVTAKSETPDSIGKNADEGEETFKAKLQEAINYNSELRSKLAGYAAAHGQKPSSFKIGELNFGIKGKVIKNINIFVTSFEMDDDDIIESAYKVDLTGESGNMLPKFIEDKIRVKTFKSPGEAHDYGKMISNKLDSLINEL